MASFPKVVLPIFALSLVACESGNVKNVKQGSLNVCSSKTIEQMVNGFLENVKWSDGESQRGNAMVIVNGDAEYLGDKSNIELQFAFNEDGTSFHQSYAMVNGREIDIMQSNRILKRMCRDDLARLAEKTASIQSQKDQLRKAGQELTPELLEADKDLGERLGGLSENEMDLLWEFFEDDSRMASYATINKVKNGTIFTHSTTTVGKAFNATFANGQWSEGTTAKGQRFVEFVGKADVDFLELIAAGIYKNAGENVGNPLSGRNAMHQCFGDSWAKQYQSNLMSTLMGAAVASLGMISLDGGLEGKIFEAVKADFVYKLATYPQTFKVQFVFDDYEHSVFHVGFYGFVGQEWSSCDVTNIMSSYELLDFAYSGHSYTEFDYEKIAKEIVDQAETANQLPDEILKKTIAGLSVTKSVLVKNTVLKDERVVKRMDDAKKAAEEQKRLEEEEAARKAEEEAAALEARQKANLKTAMGEILPVFKKYRSKMFQWVKECNGGCSDYPYWDIIGFTAPKSKFFEFDGANSDYSWYVAMSTIESEVGVECYYRMDCMNAKDKCQCSVAESCKDFTPNLSSVCEVEFN